MALIKDIVAASYPAVLNKMRKPENQWSENALLAYLEKHGYLKRINFGDTIQAQLDYQAGAGGFLATDLAATSVTKTSVIGAADYAIADLSAENAWSDRDEARNAGETRKVDFVKGIIQNAVTTHDQKIEAALFAATATQGFESILTLMSTDGLGTIGGIVAGTDTWWKNQFDDYTTGGALLDASLTTVYNNCSKGSGSKRQPSLVITSADSHGDLEARLQANQRYMNSNEGNMGFKVLKFKNADVVFSPEYSGVNYFFVNKENFQLLVSKEKFRQESVIQLESANGYALRVYSAVALVTNGRSRLGVSFT